MIESRKQEKSLKYFKDGRGIVVVVKFRNGNGAKGPSRDNNLDGKPDAMKVARPVWVGGKSGDQIKRLPIDIYCDCKASLYKGSKC